MQMCKESVIDLAVVLIVLALLWVVFSILISLGVSHIIFRLNVYSIVSILFGFLIFLMFIETIAICIKTRRSRHTNKI